MFCAFCAHGELTEWLKHADDGQEQPADRRWSVGSARTRTRAKLAPAIHFMPICGLQRRDAIATWDMHCNRHSLTPLSRRKLCDVEQLGDNPTAEAEEGGRDEAFDGSRSNAVQ
jgi:hypothetical protein